MYYVEAGGGEPLVLVMGLGADHLAWGFQPTRNTRYLDAVAINGSSAVLSAAHNAKVPQLLHMSSVGTYAAGRYGERVCASSTLPTGPCRGTG